MAKAELSYNPYLLETKVKFMGQEPKINSMVERYKHSKLQSWINQLPEIFYNEMNGYDFDLDFSGTKIDFNQLKLSLIENGINENEVRLFHRSELQDATTKVELIESLLEWIKEQDNKRFDLKKFLENNNRLFFDDYTFFLIQGNNIEIPDLSDKNISIENIDNINEFPDDLTSTPLIFYVDKTNLNKNREIFEYILNRDDVIDKQLFFIIHPSLNEWQVVRTLQDYKFESVQLIQNFDDKKILDFAQQFPISDFIYETCIKFREAVTKIKNEINEQTKMSREQNLAIYKQIDELEEAISKLKKTKNYFVNKKSYEGNNDLNVSYGDFIYCINNWRNKKVKINDVEFAKREAKEFNSFLNICCNQLLEEYQRILEKENKTIYYSSKNKFAIARYKETFIPKTENKYELNSNINIEMTNDFLKEKHEKMVEKPEDLINKLNPFKKQNNGPIELVKETTYYYHEWKDLAKLKLIPTAKLMKKEIIDSLIKYYDNLANEYVEHINEVLKKLNLEKDNVALQLSKNEQILQADSDWINTFEDLLNEIERG